MAERLKRRFAAWRVVFVSITVRRVDTGAGDDNDALDTQLPARSHDGSEGGAVVCDVDIDWQQLRTPGRSVREHYRCTKVILPLLKEHDGKVTSQLQIVSELQQPLRDDSLLSPRGSID